MALITIPDFPFSAHFYPEILEDLISYLRLKCPELTDEDPTEPHIQLLRAYALAGHLNNVLVDLVANEMFLPTAKLRSSVKALLKLIGQDLAQASPASCDLLAQLANTAFTADLVIVPAGSVFSTLETRAAQAVEYEALDDVHIVERTDLVGVVYSYNSGGNYTDHTAEAQSSGGAFTPQWTAPSNNDALYIGHRGILWDTIQVNLAVAGVGLTGIWEYFDGNFDQGVPSSVTNLGSTLRFNVNSILGTASRVGTVVRVRSAVTGAYQDLTVTFSGGENRIETAAPDAFLEQSSPSVVATDYIVGTDWREIPNVTDGPANFTATGAVTYIVPQSVTANWNKTTVGAGILAVEAYWIRYRIISVSGPTAPQINEVKINTGKQYVLFPVSQGRSRTDDPLGSSTGDASQEFTLSNFPVIDDDNIVITVDESGVDKVYDRVSNFLNSVSTDRHYTVEFDDDGAAIIAFGDGVNGKIPPAGANNIKANYRTMDEIDGNVGHDTIQVNRSGVAYLANVTNPRGAAGFSTREGSTDEDLARAKIAGPASLRTRERAVTPEDCETVAVDFLASDGSTPVKRALAIEEAFGPKTIEVVVVGAGGQQVDASKLQEIEDHFNGTDDERGVIVMNNQATVTNFTPEVVNVTVTVEGGNQTAILTALTALLNPLAKENDGTYVWSFGGVVSQARIIAEIMNTTPKPRNLDVSTMVPSADVALATRELPTVGTLTVTVTA